MPIQGFIHISFLPDGFEKSCPVLGILLVKLIVVICLLARFLFFSLGNCQFMSFIHFSFG